ncbi:LOW QUALITY PROTEIN: protein mono-ADP-ribosyltransferase PARP14-like [Xyrauchen texanus]|uniref:LOW QUALITY PROTEIN: protein mono-ADP-ribosyltransferase PARP14-like n=1 Tax=Xyrauchen texanus TaxID=154827 RepID=UPI0022428660|nr:LOW QUALITY PROTEIN: protein mono-ADP-ribosyltransferase PARP14-like [Xyrauchen texanus]
MEENSLILEGLPEDFDKVKSKLNLYFRNKRKSGAAIAQIQEHPEDKRKAILIYMNEEDLKKVLDKKTHKIDFKSQGTVEVTVKLPEETSRKKTKPAILPKPKPETIAFLKQSLPAHVPPVRKHTTSQKDDEEDCEISDLLITSQQSVDKETLQMYVEQFAENFKLRKHENNSWILKLNNQSDFQKILAQKEHEFGISVNVYKEGGLGQKVDPRRFILTGFDGNTNCKKMSVFIGSCSKTTEHTWEMLDEDRIIVTFKQEIDVKSFVSKCTSRPLQGRDIDVTRMELTDSVLVQGDLSQISEDVLSLYFSNKKRSRGAEIKSFIWINRQKSVVITFEDCHVAHEVVEQKHNVCGTELKVSLFYSSLQKDLSGEKPSLTDSPTKTNIPVHADLLRFIEKNEKFRKQLENNVKLLHSKVLLDSSATPSALALEMDVDKESLTALRIGPTWETKTKREVQSFLSQFDTEELTAEKDVWDRVKNHRLNTDDAAVSYRDFKAVIVGVKEEVTVLSEKMGKLLKDAAAEVDVERNTVDVTIQLDCKEKFDLVKECVQSKLGDVSFTHDENQLIFHLSGLKDKVSSAEVVIKRAQENMIKHQLKLSSHLIHFLKSLDLNMFEQEYFSPNHIPAKLINLKDCVGIFVEKENLKRAEDKISEIIKEEVIPLSTKQTSENWTHFLRTLQDQVELSHNGRNIRITPSDQQVILCGLSSVVADATRKVRGYLENKEPTTEDVPLKSVREVEFVDSCMNLSELPQIKCLDATILACKTSNSPGLKVTAAKDKIKEAVSVVKQRVSSIVVKEHQYCKAGEAKVLEKHEANVEAKAKEFLCNVYLSQEQAGKSGPPKSFTHKIDNSMTLRITQGHVHHFTADALTCPMNASLTFANPVAKRFLQFGGDQITEVCSKYQKEKQSALPGDVILSSAGKLNTKTLLYAVLPNKGQALDSHYLQSAVYNSLLRAEGSHCTSIGFSALGCESFGFSVKESGIALREAILQFCTNQQHSPANIRDICVVESDEKIVEEYNSLIEEQGFPDTFSRPTSTSKRVPSRSLKCKHGPDKTVLIKDVSILLKKSDITKEKVDVIVNSNNISLNLDTGVSGAILKAAGKTVAAECATLGPLKAGGVVMTSGGALKCKNIAQTVGPNNAADITSSLEKVLSLCEGKRSTTLAIPAIGTGRGGIGAKESITAIFMAMEKHLTAQNSSCLKEITIVTFEEKVHDACREYFRERNKASTHVKSAFGKMPENQVKIGSVRIELKKGDITIETVRGIVNTTNSEMSLKEGVSGAIFKAAGSSVEQECKNLGPLQGDVAAVTSGGNLQCDVIIHMIGPHSAAEVRSRVKKVLERCEENQITTVSFPAVGTGGGGVKSVDAIGAMLQAFEDHFNQKTSTVIKLIYLVIDRDDVLQEFQQGLKTWTANAQDSEDEDDEESDCSSDEDSESSDQGADTSTNPIEAMIGPMKVKVLCGDITKETVDAIVNSTTTSLDLSSGVSGAILKAAGQTVVNECKTKAPQPADGVVLTKAGNLSNIKSIIHMVGQTNEKGITSSTYNVLKMCEENQIQSVSFPALGTGAGNLAAAQVANAMIEALTKFVKDSPKHLKRVNIVIFQTKMLPDFQEALKKFKKISLNVSVRKSNGPPPLTTRVPSKPPQPPLMSLATETASVLFPVMTVEVYGTSSADLAKVKKFLDDLISDECISKDVQSSHIADFPETDKKNIVTLSQTNQVSVLLAGLDKLTISGKKDDVLDAELKIRNFIQEARDREIREGEVKRLRQTLCWEVARGEHWKSLEPSVSYEVELAYHKKLQSFQYRENGETYMVDFKEMKVTNSKSESCRIKRSLHGDSDTAIIQTPPTWSKMDGKDLEIIMIKSDSEEYKKIQTDFLNSSKHKDVSPVQVLQIDRIQSQSQWHRYCVLKQAVDKKYPKQPNEHLLYHGTTKDICQKINKNGFNRSFCGRNAVVHGDGTYFAKDAWYSCHDQYSNPDDKGQKYIYRARVVTGSPCKSKQGMKEPDPIHPQDPQAGLHDCAVDNLQDPFIFVVFCDAGAYPEYLITFKTV